MSTPSQTGAVVLSTLFLAILLVVGPHEIFLHQAHASTPSSVAMTKSAVTGDTASSITDQVFAFTTGSPWSEPEETVTRDEPGVPQREDLGELLWWALVPFAMVVLSLMTFALVSRRRRRER